MRLYYFVSRQRGLKGDRSPFVVDKWVAGGAGGAGDVLARSSSRSGVHGARLHPKYVPQQ